MVRKLEKYERPADYELSRLQERQDRLFPPPLVRFKKECFRLCELSLLDQHPNDFI
jgi:hypothetical protein